MREFGRECVESGLVSVVVPTYNRAYCLGRALESVVGQTYANWELIVVDDGSTDGTAEMVQAGYGSEGRMRYIRQANAGVSAARNAGIREARGEYVAFMDSDDVWKPWKLEAQLACLGMFPEAGMVWAEFEGMDENGVTVSERYLRKMYGAYRHFGSFEDLFERSTEMAVPGLGTDARVYCGTIYSEMLLGSLVHTSTVLLKRERLEQVVGFDEGLALSGEDYDFHFRTCKWGPVCLLDAASVKYQLGFEDRLTKHTGVIAQNFLRTVEAAVEREAGTGVFPAKRVDQVLAEAHGWVAGVLFEAKDYRGTRRHALKSLRRRLRQPRLIVLLLLASAPRRANEGMLRAYRNLKR